MDDDKILQDETTTAKEIDPDELNRVVGGSSYSQDGEWVINNDSIE